MLSTNTEENARNRREVGTLVLNVLSRVASASGSVDGRYQAGGTRECRPFLGHHSSPVFSHPPRPHLSGNAPSLLVSAIRVTTLRQEVRIWTAIFGVAGGRLAIMATGSMTTWRAAVRWSLPGPPNTCNQANQSSEGLPGESLTTLRIRSGSGRQRCKCFNERIIAFQVPWGF